MPFFSWNSSNPIIVSVQTAENELSWEVDAKIKVRDLKQMVCNDLSLREGSYFALCFPPKKSNLGLSNSNSYNNLNNLNQSNQPNNLLTKPQIHHTNSVNRSHVNSNNSNPSNLNNLNSNLNNNINPSNLERLANNGISTSSNLNNSNLEIQRSNSSVNNRLTLQPRNPLHHSNYNLRGT